MCVQGKPKERQPVRLFPGLLQTDMAVPGNYPFGQKGMTRHGRTMNRVSVLTLFKVGFKGTPKEHPPVGGSNP